MLFRGSLIAQASGSVAGNTFSRNRGGQYIRNRSTPVNPQTARQTAVRGFFAQLANLWATVLTTAEREAWDTYAANVSVLNALGDAIFLTGFNMYIRSNVPRLQAALTRVDAAPTLMDLGDFTPVTAITTATGNLYSITFAAGDAWVDEDDSSMLIYASMSKGVTINFFKGPFQQEATIDGNSTTAPTSPAGGALNQLIVSGNKTFLRVRVTRADGRLSTDQIIPTIAA